ncbi:MAG: haloalkane dehalogenase [Myxococcales bacterium]|jgi:haloalkane dehalogenase|nr:haloalkane dehalogenase [Myxococcales bacterium]MBL0198030.1 haloalkane dehalogenase [Myxococcales bacterium]HQY61259.1 haloalkane dehalogenase [Polyangiaceae bacterium]
MRALRTPDERFADLPGFPFAPHYSEVSAGDGAKLRMHHVDEGQGAPVLLLHGEPTWSFLYRKMIPVFVEAGLRAVAPDLIGFGRSDKPMRQSDYSYARHVAWLEEWLQQVDLTGVTLVCQDWGSLLGLRLVAARPERFARVVVSNGFLPTARTRTSPAFQVWRTFAAASPLFPIGRIVRSGCVTSLGARDLAAYDAPFPSSEYKAGARAFPALVPTRESDPEVPANRAAWEALGRFEKPFLTLFGKNDPILGRADAPLQRHVPGAAGQPHERFWGGHFVQEDRGEFLAEKIVSWMRG